MPLLDEAAELLGEIDEQVLRATAMQAEEELAAAREAEEHEREAELAYAREVLELTGRRTSWRPSASPSGTAATAPT